MYIDINYVISGLLIDAFNYISYDDNENTPLKRFNHIAFFFVKIHVFPTRHINVLFFI